MTPVEHAAYSKGGFECERSDGRNAWKLGMFSATIHVFL